MFLAAIAHYYSFSHLPFADTDAERGNCCSTFMSMWDVRDVRDDVIDHARYLGMYCWFSHGYMVLYSCSVHLFFPKLLFSFASLFLAFVYVYISV